MKTDWIDLELVRDFAAEETDAYRLCTCATAGWNVSARTCSSPTKPKRRAIASRRSSCCGRSRCELQVRTSLRALLAEAKCGARSAAASSRAMPARQLQRSVAASAAALRDRFRRPVIPSGCLSINAKIDSSSGASRREVCSIASPTPVRFPSRRRLAGAKTVSIDLSKKSLDARTRKFCPQ